MKQQSYMFHVPLPSLTPLTLAQIHCGFVRPPPGSPPSSSTGFGVSEEDQAFMNGCRLVVASAIFNDWDRLHPPQRSKVNVGRGMRGMWCWGMWEMGDVASIVARKQADSSTSAMCN